MAGKGGGAWKVAYADFVTAMMAFFLVMWICGQDTNVKRAVAYYFQDPFNTSQVGTAKQAPRTGSVSEMQHTGMVPQSESVALGRGRNSYTPRDEKSIATKMVSDWLFSDKQAAKHWRDQARRQRQLAQVTKDSGKKPESVEEIASVQLAKQLREEFTRGIPSQAASPYKDLLTEVLTGVNWNEIAEDLVLQN
jgi:flagellar motor protein MotB